MFEKEQLCLLRPFSIERLQILLNNTNFLFLVSLVEVFQDDGNVHIDHNHEVDDDERHKEDDCYEGESTVSVG